MSRNPDVAPRSRGVNFFDVGVVGRRTGITMKANVKKDEDGLDNIDDFWADEDEERDENADDVEDEQEDEQEYIEHDDGNQSEDQSAYYDQDLPEELLATPTSRRSRAVPMTNSGSRRGLLSSSALDHGAEEYQSPSFHAVKKRLVFTKEAPAESGNINSESSSPALDRLLSVSKQKALMTKAASSPGYSSKLAQAKGANKPTPSYISKALGTNRPGVNKAFDLGSDDNIANEGSDNSDKEPAPRPTESRPTKATPKRKTDKSIKTPIEIRRKPQVLPPPPSLSPSPPPETHVDDHELHEEDASNNHNGFTFSDEESRRLSHKDSENEEEEEQLIDHRRTTSSQSKTHAKETKETKASGTTKAPSRANIPQKSAKAPTTTTKKPAAKSMPRSKKVSVSDGSNSGGSDSDDHSVPISRQAATQRHKAASTAPKSGLIEIPVVPEAHEPDGTRKSSRTRLQPLEWWKNEKVVLGKSDVQGVAEIKAVIKAPAVEERPLGATKRKTAKRPAKSATNGHVAKKRVRGPDSDTDDVHAEPVMDDEEADRLAIEEQGLKEEPEQMVDTVDWNSNETILRRVAESKDVVAFNKVQGGGYQYHRGLEDIKYIVSGKMKILPGGQKPVGNGAKTSMVFYVISGAAQVCVNKTEFALSTGGSFLIPKGNVYSFTNLSLKRDLILFFAQSRQQEGSAASTPAPTSSKGTTVEAAQAAAHAAAAASASAVAAKPKPKSKSKSKKATSSRTARRGSTSTAV